MDSITASRHYLDRRQEGTKELWLTVPIKLAILRQMTLISNIF